MRSKTVKLGRRFEKLVKQIAERESRTIRVIVERAIEDYNKNGRK